MPEKQSAKAIFTLRISFIDQEDIKNDHRPAVVGNLAA